MFYKSKKDLDTTQKCTYPAQETKQKIDDKLDKKTN